MMYYAISLVLVLLDQLTKAYMSGLLALCTPTRCESIDLLPVFKLTLHHNAGAAFSFLADAGGWQRWFLVSISVVVSGVVATWLYQIRREQPLLAMALALILSGAIGNLIDRMIQGYVVDFLVFYYDSWYFPAFNVADSCITVGAGLMILDLILEQRRAQWASEKQ